MKREFMLAGVALLTMVTFGYGQTDMKAANAKGKAVGQSPSDKALIARELEVWEIVKNKQLDDYRTYYADNFRAVSSGGITTSHQEAEGVRNLQLKTYSLTDTKVVFPTKDTAVLTYKVTVQGSFQGQDISGAYFASSVWVKQGGKWLAILHTEAKAE
jgi:hypothetical protein